MAQAAGKQEPPEPVGRGAEQQNFQYSPHRPVCIECGASSTGKRWEATERVGWGASPGSVLDFLGCDGHTSVHDDRVIADLLAPFLSGLPAGR